MTPNTTSFKNPIADSPTIGEKISDAGTDVKEKISEFGRNAAEKLDDNRTAAASGLSRAASTLHEKADSLPGGQKVTALAHTTADKLTTTADYLRDHDVKKMMADVEEVVKRNPGPALFAAGIIGFLVARAFTRNEY